MIYYVACGVVALCFMGVPFLMPYTETSWLILYIGFIGASRATLAGRAAKRASAAAKCGHEVPWRSVYLISQKCRHIVSRTTSTALTYCRRPRQGYCVRADRQLYNPCARCDTRSE
eukprot:2310405-Pleurochrysis_carterae.AAC.2